MSITSKDVLELLAEWLEAKRTEKKKEPEHAGYGGFGFSGFSLGMDLDEQPIISEADQKLIRAQTAFETFVNERVDAALQQLIDAANGGRANVPEHQLYPERG